jgi:predicted nucleic acid-binding protein
MPTTRPDAPPVAVLDAGAFIAYERRPNVRGLIEFALRTGLPMVTSCAVVAQAWHGSPRQARLARLLRSELLDERSLDADAARAVGVRCASAGVADVVDGHIAEIAIDLDAVVVTSDSSDLAKLGVPVHRLRPV